MLRTKISKMETAALGTSIRRLRQRLKLSQGRFAAELGVSQQKVSEWERGQRLRTVIVAWRLADFLTLHRAK
jgi:DNA-binding transcriptional regulator YiaG